MTHDNGNDNRVSWIHLGLWVLFLAHRVFVAWLWPASVNLCVDRWAQNQECAGCGKMSFSIPSIDTVPLLINQAINTCSKSHQEQQETETRRQNGKHCVWFMHGPHHFCQKVHTAPYINGLIMHLISGWWKSDTTAGYTVSIRFGPRSQVSNIFSPNDYYSKKIKGLNVWSKLKLG